jgi:PAS domain S-box-containing protein
MKETMSGVITLLNLYNQLLQVSGVSMQEFMPHGHCYFWLPEILWLHAISDSLIALAYFTIPLGIYRIMRRRKDIAEARPLLVLFILFIVFCGLTHLTEVYTIWNASYLFSGSLKALTALVSVVTAVMLWPTIPRILKIPSANTWRRSNLRLEQEVGERIRAEKALQKQQENLEKLVQMRTRDLEATTLKLRQQISEFEEAEQKIMFQAQLLDQVETAVIATDVHYHIIYWNHCAEKLYGWKSQEVIGKTASDIMIRPDQRKSGKKLLYRLKSRKTWEGDFNIPHKNGHKVPVHLNCSATLNPAGQQIGYTLVSFDISHHVKSEMILQKAKDKAEQKASARQDFLSTMSHEIRTPLNVIMGMTRLILDDKPREDQMEYLNSLQFSAKHLLTIINDILDLSKIEAGKIRLEKISFSPREVLRGVVKAFAVRAAEKGLDLQISLGEKVPAYVIGDQVRLTQVLNNLVSNSIKFTDSGFVKISISAVQRMNRTTELHIRVQDSGIGISREKIDTIFDSFTQAEEDTTRKFGGTGLGLTITKKLIDLQGGTLEVESVEQQGSTFSCCIPYETDTEAKQKTRQPADEQPLIRLNDYRLLLVEDNHANRMVASNFLRKMGATVDFAQNGEEAVQLASEQQYDIILMDLQMPVMDGYEATRCIRAMGGHHTGVPIIALTADVVADVRQRAKEAGMNDYLSKPFVPENLNATLARHLNIEMPRHPQAGASENTAKQEEDAFTLRQILAEYGNDTQFTATLLQSLGRSLGQLGSEVRRHSASGDVKALRALIHKMRPSLKMLENPELESRLVELRKKLPGTEAHELEPLLQAVESSADESLQMVRGLGRQNKSSISKTLQS